MGAGHLTRLTEADLVDGGDAALILRLVDEVLDGVVRVLQVLGHVAADPVCGIGPFALHQVSQDGASSVIGGGGPGQADGAVGGVGDTGVQHGAGRSYGHSAETQVRSKTQALSLYISHFTQRLLWIPAVKNN